MQCAIRFNVLYALPCQASHAKRIIVSGIAEIQVAAAYEKKQQSNNCRADNVTKILIAHQPSFYELTSATGRVFARWQGQVITD